MMRKNERRIEEKVSQLIDDVLAGEDVPVDDSLLSLAAELAAAPARHPSPTFAQQLRQRLLTSPPSQPVHPIWRWSMGAVALTTMIAILLVLVWNPWHPPAREVLARAEAAISVQPGQIEYLVAHATHQGPGAESGEVLTQIWIRIGETSDGNLTGVEQLILAYDPDDVALENPKYASYWSLSGQWCTLGYIEEQLVPAIPDTDENGCLTHDIDNLGLSPALGSMSSPQDWIDALGKRWKMDRKAHPDHLAGRSVYRLEFSGECEMLEVRNGAIEKEPYACKGALYIDRETYMLVGGTSESTTRPVFTSSYTLVSYEVLDQEVIGFDPLAWPPRE